jgi:hypothetical protein
MAKIVIGLVVLGTTLAYLMLVGRGKTALPQISPMPQRLCLISRVFCRCG